MARRPFTMTVGHIRAFAENGDTVVVCDGCGSERRMPGTLHLFNEIVASVLEALTQHDACAATAGETDAYAH